MLWQECSRTCGKIPKNFLGLSRYLTFINICWRPQNWNRILCRPSRINDSSGMVAPPPCSGQLWNYETQPGPLVLYRRRVSLGLEDRVVFRSSLINMRYLDNSKKIFGILRNVLAYSCQGDIFAPYETQPRALVLWRLFFYIGLEVRVVFRKTIWIVSSLFFFSFYYNNHLLRSDSSK